MAKKRNYIQSQWPQAFYSTHAGYLSTGALALLLYSIPMAVLKDQSANYSLIITGCIWSMISIMVYILIDYTMYKDSLSLLGSTIYGFISMISVAYIYLFGLYLVLYEGLYGFVGVFSSNHKFFAALTALISILAGYCLVWNLDKITTGAKKFKQMTANQSSDISAKSAWPTPSAEDPNFNLANVIAPAAKPIAEENRDNFPQYYQIDDVLVRLDENTKSGRTTCRVMLTGAPYSVAKALSEGTQTSKQEAHRVFKLLYPGKKMETEV